MRTIRAANGCGGEERKKEKEKKSAEISELRQVYRKRDRSPRRMDEIGYGRKSRNRMLLAILKISSSGSKSIINARLLPRVGAKLWNRNRLPADFTFYRVGSVACSESFYNYSLAHVCLHTFPARLTSRKRFSAVLRKNILQLLHFWKRNGRPRPVSSLSTLGAHTTRRSLNIRMSIDVHGGRRSIISPTSFPSIIEWRRKKRKRNPANAKEITINQVPRWRVVLCVCLSPPFAEKDAPV